MSSDPKTVIRCAIYTRKSSEEGLEQSFNSLDAQREACHAFILSQRQEGWRAAATSYDDGGYSGGTLERPALQRLLKDIDEEKVDTIVVYKVDRLTRSLADFAKIVEALDARGVSFVSVTQQFNTTTSMGRLTLNVLLSFAQFEREVTGERIRDKIAASKRKGMWMGGRAPLGYYVKERKLVVNEGEADFVRRLFELYLEVGCVSRLKVQLDREAIKSKERTSAAGIRSGGSSYFRGALYTILKNRIYVGDIHHNGQYFAGEHTAIISRDLWERVDAQLRSDNQGRRNGIKANTSSMLAGLLQDSEGNRFTPSHTLKNGRRYRYYVCQGKLDDKARSKPARLPAHDIEKLVCSRLQSFLRSTRQVMDGLVEPEDSATTTRDLIVAAKRKSDELHAGPSLRQGFLRKTVRRVVIHSHRIKIEFHKNKLRAEIQGKHEPQASLGIFRVTFEGQIKRCGSEMRLVISPDSAGEAPQPVTSLLKAVARGRRWYEWIVAGEVSGRRSIAQKIGLDERHVSQILQCGFLAPDIVGAILDGRQPSDLTWKKLTRRVPLEWAEQRKRFGFAPVAVDRH